jgi:hypothetical protein
MAACVTDVPVPSRRQVVLAIGMFPVELALASLGDVFDAPAIDQHPAVLEVVQVGPL